ncbi:glycoside hydrolase family 15 protein [Streptomyces ureilyticus]|uniref:Glycoside hydrolase family 15 protein n=1 Tax=Streptomyces ureilyticus TaxID=1775131 RepID=A0ABX0DGY4_9ACTN|nr:glycoside hydrolase family 15 protein [Streptomyces ureilyticus]NGO41073.1 glycoside hydrolase family 15 protein [Streptomyces ureilyticus]
MAGRIEDYALIGDLETAALVGRDGAIDWMCLPRFDSPACFAALLGGEDNGRWRIAPAEAVSRRCDRRAYRGDTLILDTVWQTADGAVRVTDFMPPRQGVPRLVRLVEGLAGRVEMRGELRLRFLNGQVVPWTRGVDAHTVTAVAGPDAVLVRCDAIPQSGGDESCFSLSDSCIHSTFTLSAGQRRAFVLDWSPSHMPRNPRGDTTELLAGTQEFWQQWTAKCTYQGPWRDAVLRSLITLKALIYAPTGGMVAAVTTSLPECLGGERNWDYRFCWLRDSTFTLSCLLRTGYRDEAVAWRNWLVRAVAGQPDDLQPTYGVSGQRRLPEKPAGWLDGYEGSRPVRFGNAAADQLQLDVYGEVLNTIYSAVRAGIPIDHHMWSVVASLMGHLERHWREPDVGLWEVRGPPRHFVHSRIMSWVAADRALRMARIAGLRSSAERWRGMRQAIHDEVCREGWDAEQHSFVQAYGSRDLDASALLLPKLGFLPPDDPRVHGTLSAVARTLGDHGFLRRYTDGGREGAFLVCSLWFADALRATGRREEADAVFERVLDTRNDVGLLSEEWDPVAHRQLGNTPQAFSHVSLVNTTFALHGTRSEARRRPV